MEPVIIPHDVQDGGDAPSGVIEVLNRSGQVLQRIAYHGGVLRVGRAYDNDIIVGDPYICPHHVELRPDNGALCAVDLDSVNGSWLGKRRKRLAGPAALGQDTLHIGHSQLRFRAERHSVAPAWRDTARHGLLSLFGRFWMLPLAVVLCGLGLSFDKVLDEAADLSSGTLASQLIYPLLGVMLWAGFWAMLNRLIAHRANFNVHLSIAGIAVFLLFFNAQAMPLLCFAMGWKSLLPMFRMTGQILIVGAALFAHLRYATHAKTRHQALGSGILALLLIGAPVMGDLVALKEFSSLPRVSPLLRPPATKIEKGVSVESFLRRSQPLRESIDQELAQSE